MDRGKLTARRAPPTLAAMPIPPARRAAAEGAPRSLLLLAPALLLWLASGPLPAAQVTKVATALDEDRPIEVDLEVGYVHERRQTRITRESLRLDAASGRQVPTLTDELQHTRTVDDLQFRLAVGLWHDLELHVLQPLALRDLQEWDYAGSAATSSLANNRIDVSGCAGSPSACSASGPLLPILNAPGGSRRAGLRDPTLGFAWSPINEERELLLHPDLFPPGKAASTWTVGLDYTLPLPGGVDDPSAFGAMAANAVTAPSARGDHPLRRKAHVFSLWTAFSKRFAVLDPYVKVRVSVPLAAKGAYDTCWHAELLSNVAPQNCLAKAWASETRYKPPATAALTLGTEIVAAEGRAEGRKLAFDLRADVAYVGPARDYTQVADALGKLTYAEEYATAGGSVAIDGRLSRWLRVRVDGKVGLETPHFLTAEGPGKDLDGDGRVDPSAGALPPSPEQNPLYDYRLDVPGRRLRAETSLVWGVTASVALSF